MTSIDRVLARCRRRRPVTSCDHPFTLVCSVAAPAAPDDVEAVGGAVLPGDARALWSTCREARLFEDVGTGQWGLVLFDPIAATRRTRQERAARPTELEPDDFVLGTFLGDQELLVLAPSETGRRRVLVALPLDPRRDWYAVGADLAEFLAVYVEADGDKFWERTQVAKDGEAHPVPFVWRPVLREIVAAIAAGQLDELTSRTPCVMPVAATVADQIRRYVTDYGETLRELPDESWTTSVCQWIGSHWEVLVDLWTVESGPADMVLDVRVFEADDEFRIEVGGVYVP